MDNLALVRMRLNELIDAKLERLKQIDEERESILKELEEARRMLALPEEPKPEPKIRQRRPMSGTHLTKEMIINLLMLGPFALTAEEIFTRCGCTDKRNLGILAILVKSKRLGKTTDGRYYVLGVYDSGQ